MFIYRLFKLKYFIEKNDFMQLNLVMAICPSGAAFSKTSIEYKVGISNYIHVEQWNVITHLCPNFKHNFKLLFNLDMDE